MYLCGSNVNDVANHLVVLSWVLLGAIAYRASTSAVSDAIDIIPFREETSQLLTDQCTMIIQGLGVPVREEVWVSRNCLNVTFKHLNKFTGDFGGRFVFI